MTKPVVQFIGDAEFYDHWDNPKWPVASVFAVDHPILGRGPVRTSQIVQRNDDGSFETLNTIYKPYNEIQNPEGG